MTISPIITSGYGRGVLIPTGGYGTILLPTIHYFLEKKPPRFIKSIDFEYDIKVPVIAEFSDTYSIISPIQKNIKSSYNFVIPVRKDFYGAYFMNANVSKTIEKEFNIDYYYKFDLKKVLRLLSAL